ncbi:hypothetical protein CHGG_06047 [Chaetomium globosum CBS 148.51]|uniref:Uncharacterized protein n=1 Tax=Chaetomium globosum (strain ATCC 6205 / CBS 148.51 / DSM 1962 / NBRC 6347 / NRRL 1970) TaxID=306901 RepID=Q2H5L8_CHAGB|nr:uncharacterized protein CHGG_06047 [Chaetomium globosum CBS 148.51]EAQ89428.1 hypothetical protein CHGG_06047 [Chaetomium globosum CBS 148.51]
MKTLKWMRLKTTCREVERLAKEQFDVPATLVLPLVVGGFNVLYRVHLEGVLQSPDVMVRLPCPNLVQFPVKKTIQVAATAKYIAENTQIPIPRHFFSGNDPTLGSFVILERVEACGSMAARLTPPNDDQSVGHILNSDIAEATLAHLWGKAAECLLQLSRLTFPRIGGLVEVKAESGAKAEDPNNNKNNNNNDRTSYEITGRPLTHNMTDMIRLANIPHAALPPPNTTYPTADAWYTALAEMHLAQLVFQHNDAVTSADDCRNKLVARLLFRQLARQGRLSCFGFAEDDWSAQARLRRSSSVEAAGGGDGGNGRGREELAPAPAGDGAFRMWGDDFRAGNMLLDEADELMTVIDWEFAYVAPTQFALDPPWWLLLKLAKTWSGGVDDWLRVYEGRLGTWFAAMERAERRVPGGGVDGPGALPVSLSRYMRESWETGRFWLSYGARKSWAFDMVFWKFLDERFFGQRAGDVLKEDLWKTRVDLLTKREMAALEPFVERKMRESKDRVIVEWDQEEAKNRLSEVLFD